MTIFILSSISSILRNKDQSEVAIQRLIDISDYLEAEQSEQLPGEAVVLI